jgi:serine/threonine protein kinase
LYAQFKAWFEVQFLGIGGTDMASSGLGSEATTFGRIIVEQGLATSEEVDEALRRFNADGGDFAELLLSQRILTHRQLKRVRRLAEERRSVGDIPGYEITGKLGEGAMAAVYKARQVSLDRAVAIKILPQRYMADTNFIQRFYAEGRAAAKLNHPNIVQAYDVGQAGEHHYFVMEYVEGYTVFDVLQEQGRYKEKEALDLMIQIAEALRHAHEKGFIHRDVKPKNVMITPEGVAKLADMGLARNVSDKEAAESEAGKAYGTPFYISPEQIRGSVDVDQRADLYGLGATFYHMVTGRVPFDAPNPSAVMHKHLRQQLIPPDHVNPNLSAGVSEIIEVMMAKDRDERYASAQDLLEDLRAVAAGNAPHHARRKFSLASLASIESAGDGGRSDGPPVQRPLSLLEQPLFWVAAISVVLNLLLIVLLLVRG